MEELNDEELPKGEETVDELKYRGLHRMKRALKQDGVMEEIVKHLIDSLSRTEPRLATNIDLWRKTFFRNDKNPDVEKFLLYLGRKKYTVAMLKDACEDLHLHDVLLWLKKTPRIGESVRLSCVYFAWPEAEVVWFRNDSRAGRGAILEYEAKVAGEPWFVHCEVRNSVGSVQSTCLSKTFFTTNTYWVFVSRLVYQSVYHKRYKEQKDERQRSTWIMFNIRSSVKIAVIVENYSYSAETSKGCGTEVKALKQAKKEMTSLISGWESVGFVVLSFVKLLASEIQVLASMLSALLPSGAYVVFFFSGHGFEAKQKRCLMGMDGVSVTVDSIVDEFQRAQPAALVLVLDCCRVRVNDSCVIVDSWSSSSSSSSRTDSTSSSNASHCSRRNKAKNLIIFSSTGEGSKAYENATSKIVDHLQRRETLSGGFTQVLMGLKVKYQTPDITSSLTENRSWSDPVNEAVKQNFMAALGSHIRKAIALKKGDTGWVFGGAQRNACRFRLQCSASYALNEIDVAVMPSPGVWKISPVQPQGVDVDRFCQESLQKITWTWVNLQRAEPLMRFGFEVNDRDFFDLQSWMPCLSGLFPPSSH
ncbi:unnamed protein product [Notodromas monacha]|uniref:Caspase family p20 domain-containing protein n=1 Tax=Notodromas monacha TaxID=399045 RepID=A0A7R9BRX7_9CRUS|nr:unnamed protein product [Notodromas monacha]CAG0919503.1 unnamed protein product [Notodromas monacha]